MTDYNKITINMALLIGKAQEMRGKILDDVIFIEFILDLIILKYFCESSSKIELFQGTLLNQEYISLNSKIKTFKNLNLGYHCKETIKELGSSLKKVREKRNELAHRMIDSTEEAIKSGQLRFIYYEGGKRKYQPIPEDSLKQDLDRLNEIKSKLFDLLRNGNFARASEIDIIV